MNLRVFTNSTNGTKLLMKLSEIQVQWNMEYLKKIPQKSDKKGAPFKSYKTILGKCIPDRHCVPFNTSQKKLTKVMYEQKK